MAHEIRNPLASLKGHAQLLAERLRDGNDSERRKADRVVHEAERLEALTTDLLDFVRSGPIDVQPADPKALVSACVDEVGADAFSLDVEAAPTTWPFDPARMRQALTNVLRNAQQATAAGTRPEVAVREHDGRLEITVRDFGRRHPRRRRAEDLHAVLHDAHHRDGPRTCRGAARDADARRDDHRREPSGRRGAVPPHAPARLTRTMARILVADDEQGLREFVAEALEDDGHAVVAVADGQEAARCISQESFDLLITDLRMPELDGLGVLRHARAEQPEMEVILLTAHGSVESAVEAMKLGAFDYLEKPISSPRELRLLAARALERRALLADRDRAAREAPPLPPLSYGDPAMEPVVEALRKVASTNASVLLTGESGTGKEVAARTLHAWSARSNGPFVAVNCAALPETLLESELFGHEKGAFTGATAARRGRIELADGGTFFLDEIGEMKPEVQAKLLRVIQDRRFERLGGTRTIESDVRWVAATNRDPAELRASGALREDLYHRLAVFPIHLPPLRERPRDILPLADNLLRRIGPQMGRAHLTLDDEAKRLIQYAEWPGNVRELANALERAAILCDRIADPGQRPAVAEWDRNGPASVGVGGRGRRSSRAGDPGTRCHRRRAGRHRRQPPRGGRAARHWTADALRQVEAVSDGGRRVKREG